MVHSLLPGAMNGAVVKFSKIFFFEHLLMSQIREFWFLNIEQNIVLKTIFDYVSLRNTFHYFSSMKN